MSQPVPIAARRYAVVSTIAAPANLTLVAALLAWSALPPVVCNLVAATLVTVPTYVACAAWVWPVEGGHARRSVAFWCTSLVNVGASSALALLLRGAGLPRMALATAPVAAYAALWVVRFQLLHRVVFRR